MFIRLINSIFNVYQYILLARVLMTWLPNLDRTHPVVAFLYGATEPILGPIRRLLPAGTMLDFSPIIAFILLSIIQRAIIQLL